MQLIASSIGLLRLSDPQAEAAAPRGHQSAEEKALESERAEKQAKRQEKEKNESNSRRLLAIP